MGQTDRCQDLAFPKWSHRKTRREIQPQKDRAFRAEVWRVDRSRCRATGVVLERVHVDPLRRGQVAHLRGRNVAPAQRTDVSNAVLMSDAMHVLSDHRGGRLLKLTDPETGEPATDASKPIRFTLYDRAGAVLWTRVSGRDPQ